jgi:uncharacterized lipoprotein YbaY
LRSTPQHTVALVLDGAFGQRLVELAARVHVWAVESPLNREVAERIRAASPGASLNHGVTLFRASPDDAPAAMIADQMDVIVEHHGPFSHDPPLDAVEVYGAVPNATVLALLGEYGWGAISVTEAGFIARQPRVG